MSADCRVGQVADREWWCAEHRRNAEDCRLVCPTREPEAHYLGEFPMTCYRCHLEADG